MSEVAKEILDRWATAVVPKDAIYNSASGVSGVNQDKVRHYGDCGYREDLVLWIAPKDCLRIEFEDEPKHNHRYILELESVAKSKGLDYCITGHGGKSDYFNLFNIKGLPLQDDNKEAKMLFVDELIPKRAKKFLDRTNLGWTLSPIIEHPHWKTKYNGEVHKILRGKLPTEHNNTYPKRLLNQIKKAKENLEKNRKKWTGTANKWVEEFLTGYCCTYKLPQGQRHSIVEKNLAAFVMIRDDKEEIKAAWYRAQESNNDSMRGWELAVLRGEFSEVSPGELAKYIKENDIPFEIPKIENINSPAVRSEDTLPLTAQVLMLLQTNQFEKATEMLSNEFMSVNHVYTTRDDEKSEMWIYKKGIYVSEAKTYLREYCRLICGEAYNTTLVNQVIAKVEVDSYIDQDDFFGNIKKDELAVENGILNVTKGTLEDFSPKRVHFNKLPVTFDPTKKMDAIMKHLSTVLQSEEDVPIMQEIFGYLLYKDYKIEKAFMFTGSGRNGKGKTVELMKRFIGPENCANITLQNIDKDPYAIGELFNKMANLSADISPTALKETGNFKNLTGHDQVSAARKYKTMVHFTNYAKFIFCCNELPKTHDDTDAFFNRWVMLDFPYKFLSQKEIDVYPEEERHLCKLADRSHIEKISNPDELSGLLNWSIEGLKRLLKRGDFSDSMCIKDIKENWIRKSDNLTAFIMDNIVEVYDAEIRKKDFKYSYLQYCKKYKLRPVSDQVIRKTLTTNYNVQHKRNYEQETFWVGIELKNPLLVDVQVKEDII